MITPYPFQQEIIDLKRNRLLLALDCGVGKTLTSLWCMEELNRTNIIIVCPLIVFQKWQKDIIALYDTPKDTVVNTKGRYTTLVYNEKTFHIATKEYFKKNSIDIFLPLKPDGLIIDECFLKGTKVLTLNGYKKIENLSTGDEVVNANGSGVVRHIKESHVDSYLQIKLSNGNIMNVTENHPILTIDGWIKAGELHCNSELLHYSSVHDIMDVYGKTFMQNMWGKNNQTISWKNATNLRQVLSDEVEVENESEQVNRRVQKCTQKQSRPCESIIRKNEKKQSYEIYRDTEKDVRNIKKNRSQSQSSWWKWSTNDSCSTNFISRSWRRLVRGAYSINRKETQAGLPTSLQVRYCSSEKDDSYRGRRRITSSDISSNSRREEGKTTKTLRVESIQIQKSGSDEKFNVYNLEVSGHPSYVVSDVLVHNCHYQAGNKSAMGKGMYKFCSQFNEKEMSIYELTATPYLSTPWNIYMLGRHLGKDWSYAGFSRKMFYLVRMGGRMIPTVRQNAHDLLKPYLKSISVRIRIEEVIKDIPEQEVKDVFLSLTEEQKKAIEEDDSEEAIVAFTKKHQIENGYVPAEILLEREIQRVECQKNAWIIDYVKKHPHTAIICRYTEQLHLIKDELEKSGLSTPILDGHTKARDTVISKARSASNPILIQAGISEGYDMPEIEHVIFASMDWSYKNYVQMLGRFLRINAPTPTVFHRLVAGPIDKKVLKAINNKETFYV